MLNIFYGFFIQVSHPQFLFLSAGSMVEKSIKCSRPEIKKPEVRSQSSAFSRFDEIKQSLKLKARGSNLNKFNQ